MLDPDGILILHIGLSSKKLRIAPQSLPLAKTSEFPAVAQNIISRSIYHQRTGFLPVTYAAAPDVGNTASI